MDESLTLLRILTLILFISITSCASYRRLAPESPRLQSMILNEAIPGKKYMITLNSGYRLHLRLKHIKDSTLHGKATIYNPRTRWTMQKEFAVPTSEIRQIKVKKFNPYLTALALTPVAITLWALSEMSIGPGM